MPVKRLQMPRMDMEFVAALRAMAVALAIDEEVALLWARPLVTGLTDADLALIAALNTPFQGSITITINGAGHLDHFGTRVDAKRALDMMGWPAYRAMLTGRHLGGTGQGSTDCRRQED